MLQRAIVYGFKNFNKEVGLPQHMTVKGTVKRLTRKYPRAYSAFRFGFAISMTFTLSMALIPGSSIPGQRQYKNYLSKKLQSFASLWFMQGLSSDPYGYILLLYRAMQYSMEHETATEQTITSTMRSINKVFEASGGSQIQKKYSLTPNLRMEHLLNTVNIFGLLLDYKRSHIHSDRASPFLKSRCIKEEIEKALDNSVINLILEQKEEEKNGRNRKQKRQNDEILRSMGCCLTIIEYLLKFPQFETKLRALMSLNTIVGAPGWEHICIKIGSADSLKASIRELYGQYPQTRPIIGKMLIKIDQNLKNK